MKEEEKRQRLSIVYKNKYKALNNIDEQGRKGRTIGMEDSKGELLVRMFMCVREEKKKSSAIHKKNLKDWFYVKS